MAKNVLKMWRYLIFYILYILSRKIQVVDSALTRRIVMNILVFSFLKFRLSNGRKIVNKVFTQYSSGENVLTIGFKEYNYYQVVYNQLFSEKHHILEPYPTQLLDKFIDYRLRVEKFPYQEKYDCIQFVGIYGYGLNTKNALVDSFAVCRKLLRSAESFIVFTINYENDFLNLKTNFGRLIHNLYVYERVDTGDGEILILRRTDD